MFVSEPCDPEQVGLLEQNRLVLQRRVQLTGPVLTDLVLTGPVMADPVLTPVRFGGVSRLLCWTCRFEEPDWHQPELHQNSSQPAGGESGAVRVGEAPAAEERLDPAQSPEQHR